MNTTGDIDGDRIRSKLLNQLGFVEPMEPIEPTSQPFDFYPVSLRKRVRPFSMPLKCEPKEETRRKTSVFFDDIVSVVSIPSHSDYSERIRSRTWADRYEISAMASRNMLEFASEGWDWRNVAGDEDMLHIEGELVHPIHGNSLLAAALKRKIPYPRAIIPLDGSESCDSGPPAHEESGAVFALDEPVERPNAPSLGSDSDDDCSVEEYFHTCQQGYTQKDAVSEILPH
jgi:hypothetical protein